MQDYVINVGRIEELQTLRDAVQLENIFFRARSAIVNGEKVLLTRMHKNGKSEKFDELSTLEDLERYKNGVFKYFW